MYEVAATTSSCSEHQVDDHRQGAGVGGHLHDHGLVHGGEPDGAALAR
jgi:hypothetical protein